MKPRSLLPALLACAVFGAARGLSLSEGETYDQVIAEKGQPASQMQAGSRRILSYPDTVIKLDGDVVISFRAADRPTPTPAPTAAAEAAQGPINHAQPADAGPMPTTVSEARLKINVALSRAREIINQPLQSYPQTPEMRGKIGFYKPGWFHDGAEIPHFIDAHIEKDQVLEDGRYEWVTSDLNEGVVFRASEKEFNPQTKFFYTDRTVPKKRLTAEEMARLDVIYHQIGMYAAYLQRAGHPWTPTAGEP